MPLFDKSEALRRARIRLARRGAVSREEAEAAHAREFLAIEWIEKVVCWAKKQGVAVDVHPRIDVGRYHSDSRRVEISSRFGPEKQLVVLLHELGHYLIEVGGRASERFPHGYSRIEEGHPGRDALHKIDVIAEEFEAWHRGWKLSQRLRISVEREYYDTIRAEYLKSYFRWAMKRGRVSDG